MIKDGTLTQEAEELIALGKEIEEEGVDLSIGTGSNRKINKELVKRLIEAKRQSKLKEGNIKENSALKKFLKILSTDKKDIPKKVNKEYGIDSAEFLEKELARAIISLRSSNNIDSDVNDLRILEDMAKITMLVSTLSGKGNRNINLARQTINNYSLTTGGASLQGAVSRQALKTNTESFSESLRYHLDKQTASVDIGTLPTTAEAKLEKERVNQKFLESVNSLRQKEGR